MTNFLQREIVITEDGSNTLFVPGLDEHFHSTHGAIQESDYVFIRNGLSTLNKQKLVVLEAGFGTGLNALLTALNKGDREIRYFSLEKYPLTEKEYSRLNYPNLLPGSAREMFLGIHNCPWNTPAEITPGFQLTKLEVDLLCFDFADLPCFDLIYFDAFSPGKQAEMWEESVLKRIAAHTASKGVFVTYCAQGEVRRRLSRSGFLMQRIPGPPGKKEMLWGEKMHSCYPV
ncbi:MAG: tRNA (5-methylaminomethyl-2-thiouridine)(34)-methyltransferase MnmD [Prolixibacteraceae bacterium]